MDDVECLVDVFAMGAVGQDTHPQRVSTPSVDAGAGQEDHAARVDPVEKAPG
jgi:hypothetical protein